MTSATSSPATPEHAGNAMTRSWSPSRLPRLRDQTARLLADPGSLVHRAMLGVAPGADRIPDAPAAKPGPYGAPPRNPEEDAEGLTRLASHLRASDLFWVTAQMGALAVASAESLTEVRWTAVDRPSRFGLLVWDGGIGTVHFSGLDLPVVATSWAPHSDNMAVCAYMSRYQMAEWAAAVTGRPVPLDEMPPLLPMWSETLPAGPHWTQATELGSWRTVLTTLYASWVLMQQGTVVDRSRADVDPAVRRSYRRAQRPDPEVTLIDLRRLYMPPHARDEGGPGRTATAG